MTTKAEPTTIPIKKHKNEINGLLFQIRGLKDQLLVETQTRVNFARNNLSLRDKLDELYLKIESCEAVIRNLEKQLNNTEERKNDQSNYEDLINKANYHWDRRKKDVLGIISRHKTKMADLENLNKKIRVKNRELKIDNELLRSKLSKIIGLRQGIKKITKRKKHENMET